MQLFNRIASVTVNGRKLNTRVRFTIAKFKGGGVAPDSKVSVYNLSQNTRNAVEAAPAFSQALELSAGYGSSSYLLYSGYYYYAHTERTGPDIITTFETKGDQNNSQVRGLQYFKNLGIQYSGAQSDWDIYLACKNLLSAYGIGKGMLSPGAQKVLQAATYPTGSSGNGTVKRVLDKIMRKNNLRWNLDLGALNVFKPGEFATDSTVLLSLTTGMIGFPTKADAGNYKVRSLLNPEIVPGCKIKIQSLEAPDPVELEVQKVTHEGDSLEGPWYSEVESLQPGFNLMLNGGGIDDGS